MMGPTNQDKTSVQQHGMGLQHEDQVGYNYRGRIVDKGAHWPDAITDTSDRWCWLINRLKLRPAKTRQV